jgi:hypothetical protein
VSVSVKSLKGMVVLFARMRTCAVCDREWVPMAWARGGCIAAVNARTSQQCTTFESGGQDRERRRQTATHGKVWSLSNGDRNILNRPTFS